jgi:hypothetical protein
MVEYEKRQGGNMKISDLIIKAKIAYRKHGDIEVLVDGYSGIHDVEEAGVDVDDTGFMIWIGGVREDV